MKIISTTDISKRGNNCYINETVSLVEQFGIYAIIVCQKITGCVDQEDIFTKQVTTDYDTAVKMYKDYEGVLEEQNG